MSLELFQLSLLLVPLHVQAVFDLVHLLLALLLDLLLLLQSVLVLRLLLLELDFLLDYQRVQVNVVLVLVKNVIFEDIKVFLKLVLMPH